jgi:hypothetical protein
MKNGIKRSSSTAPPAFSVGLAYLIHVIGFYCSLLKSRTAAAASKKRLPLPFCGMLFTASLLTVYPSPLNLR